MTTFLQYFNQFIAIDHAVALVWLVVVEVVQWRGEG